MTHIYDEIAELQPWWEDILIKGISTKSIDKGAGRNKKLLFSELFDKRLGKDFSRGKSVIDLGCNAGGSTVQLLERGASFVTCVEGNDLFFRQLQLVVNNTAGCNDRTKLVNYFLGGKTELQLEEALGAHDIGLCIGLIYHMKRDDVVALMKYLIRNTDRCIFSSPVSNSGRSTDWTISYEGIDALLEKAGFKGKRVILDAKKGEENWSWMTNTYYFEALK